MSCIARLAVVAAAAVVGAATTDVIWRGLYIERNRVWMRRFAVYSYQYDKSVIPVVAPNNIKSSEWTTL